jgi:SMI1 / KNR4 family (SUKH-1)
VSIDPLLAELAHHHFLNPPATVAQIEAFEHRVGWRLDPDLRAFYLQCDGADLFKRPNSPFRILPLSRIVRARVAIMGEDDDQWGPASWYAFCALYDSNYVLLDVSKPQEGRYPIIDGYREMFPNPEYCRQIAGSFSEFLAGALRSNGNWFWLEQSS